MHYPPFYSDNHRHTSDEEAIRCEASMLIDLEYTQRHTVKWDGLPVPPWSEEMRFDNDRGL